MKRKIVISIFLICFLVVHYRIFAFGQVRNVLNDFEAAIHGEEIENEVNREHLERYYPRNDYYTTYEKCNNVLLFGHKARLYMFVDRIRVLREDDGTIKTENLPDYFTVDLEKKNGEWVIKKVNFIP